MKEDFKIVLGLSWPAWGSFPAITLPLFGAPAWVGFVGAICLALSMFFVACSAHNRGQIAGMRFMRKLWGRA